MFLYQDMQSSKYSLLLELILDYEIVKIPKFYFLDILFELDYHCYFIIVELLEIERKGEHVIEAEIF